MDVTATTYDTLHVRAREALEVLRQSDMKQRFCRLKDGAGRMLLCRGSEKPATLCDLVMLSSAVCGIEFCYAAETAFVSPTLLSLGLQEQYMTMTWCLGPLLGFLLTPVLGSLSDTCRSPLGRRRPFIVVLSLGILLGLVLVPNGKDVGVALGDGAASPTDFPPSSPTWGIIFTVAGAVLLDFCCDACQSPARAYLLDVASPELHATGLGTFTAMAGIGGAVGYAMGAINWENTFLGQILGGHVRVVYTIVSVVFVLCLLTTVTSFPETPLGGEYEALNDEGSATRTVREYLGTIVRMPRFLRVLCLTNLFCWMSLICYSLYFTDFVAEAVFAASPGDSEYEDGVRFGCWGMCLYSLSCSAYSCLIETLVRKWGAKPVYVCSQLVYTGGMVLMAVSRSKVGVIVLSSTAGFMYATLFTMPYLLVARYHFVHTQVEEDSARTEVRGLGTDVAAVGSMVFLAQFVLSTCMGSLVATTGSTAVTVWAASFLSTCGAICAYRVTYFDL